MLNANLIHEVELLSLKERVALMEYLVRSVQKELEEPQRKKASPLNRALEENRTEKEEPRLLTNEEKQALRARIREELGEYRSKGTEISEHRNSLEAIPSLESLHAWHGPKLERGALQELSHLTDEDIEKIIAEHLTEKYLK